MLMTLAEAVNEFGEEFGPRIHKLIHMKSPRNEPSTPESTISACLREWCKRHELEAELRVLSPGAPPGEWKFTGEQARAKGLRDVWTVVVVQPGECTLEVPVAPFPEPDCRAHEIFDYARKLSGVVLPYWGGADNASAVSHLVRMEWLRSRALPSDSEMLLAALHMFSNYARELGAARTRYEMDFLRAVVAALRSIASESKPPPWPPSPTEPKSVTVHPSDFDWQTVYPDATKAASGEGFEVLFAERDGSFFLIRVPQEYWLPEDEHKPVLQQVEVMVFDSANERLLYRNTRRYGSTCDVWEQE